MEYGSNVYIDQEENKVAQNEKIYVGFRISKIGQILKYFVGSFHQAEPSYFWRVKTYFTKTKTFFAICKEVPTSRELDRRSFPDQIMIGDQIVI